jgi:small-conductance mechanosensitive channel
MPFLAWSFLGNSLRAWLLALLTTIVILAALWLTKRLLISRLAALAGRTKTDLDDLLVSVLKRTNFYLLTLLALYAGSLILRLPQTVDYWFGKVALFVVLVQVGIWGEAFITTSIQHYQEKNLEGDAGRVTTLRAASFLVKLVLFTIILLLALENLGIEITTLVASLGVGSIAVALAVQNILADLFASLSIALDQPFVIGDFIIVDDYMGTVENVGLKTTRIRSLSGEQLIFANNDLLNSRIRNYKRMGERRVLFSFGVTYETPYEKLEKIPGIVRQMIEAQKQTRFDRAHFSSFGDSALLFEVVYYVLSADYNQYMDIQQVINLELIQRFEGEGIEFAYPTQTLYVSKLE